MSFIDFVIGFPFLIAPMAIVIVAVSLGAYKLVKEWLPW